MQGRVPESKELHSKRDPEISDDPQVFSLMLISACMRERYPSLGKKPSRRSRGITLRTYVKLRLFLIPKLQKY